MDHPAFAGSIVSLRLARAEMDGFFSFAHARETVHGITVPTLNSSRFAVRLDCQRGGYFHLNREAGRLLAAQVEDKNAVVFILLATKQRTANDHDFLAVGCEPQ